MGRIAQSVYLLATVRGSDSGGSEIFRTCPDPPWGPTRLLYNEYRVFPEGKDRPGLDADPSSLLVPCSRKSIAIPLLSLWAVRPVQSLSACTRVPFTFIFYTQHNLISLFFLFRIYVRIKLVNTHTSSHAVSHFPQPLPIVCLHSISIVHKTNR